ncbi:MAG: UDPGP type 1 family protein [Phycisphaerae bacterium]|mgnify:CR=1 FL=1|nr:UDPGP type 1 family protein [Phycisphaerae bacterium]
MIAQKDVLDHYRQTLVGYHQEHLLAFWPRLDDRQREQLLEDLAQIDFDECSRLIDHLVRQKPVLPLPRSTEPPQVLPSVPRQGSQIEQYEAATALGIHAIRSGQVAAFTVAGGQGTRLGFDGPKGAFQITPVRKASLFQWFAESLRGVQRRYGACPRWYIMTSPSNDAQTRDFFQKHAYFGLRPDNVVFFTQGQMPAFRHDGRIALAEPHRVALSPDGHGGSLRALRRSGALDDMRAHGIQHISYFQVDNPLVKTIDPLFIGLHIQQNSEMSSKAVKKADDLERVGNFCLADGRLTVIEYSDLPDELAHARNPDGSRRFDAGSIAVHVLAREFVERLTAENAAIQLPWHRADKKVRIIDEDGRPVEPDQPNVVKLEMFIFDAIPLARNPLVLYTPREEEFSPVKNATGVDSAATARRDLVRRAARWLEQCGYRVPRDTHGEPDLPLEISPAVALDASDLCAHLQNTRPVLTPKQPFLLA